MWRCLTGLFAAWALWCMVHPTSVLATTTYRIGLPRAVRSADLIVEGKVRTFQTRTALPEGAPPGITLDGLHVTDVLLAVKQVYKGRLASKSLRVRVFGGERTGRSLRGAGLPFRAGEQVLLMLWHNGDDPFPIVGFHQGFYRLRPTGPDGTMPDLTRGPRRCRTCTEMVLDGRDHVVTRLSSAGKVSTFNAGMHPAFQTFIGAHQAVAPAETARPQGGVLPAGMTLPPQRLTPAALREAIWQSLVALELPRDLPRLGNPDAPPSSVPTAVQPVILQAEGDGTHRADAEDVPVADPMPDVPADSGSQE